MRALITCLLVFGMIMGASAQMENLYSIDNSHSIIDFKATHKGFGAVRGTFENYSGSIRFDEKDIKNTSATIIIDVKSLSTRNEGRDGILKGKFFESEKFPSIIFQSTGVIQKEDHYLIEGNIKVRDITKKIQIPFAITSTPTLDQFKHKRIAFGGHFRINRKDFELFYRGNDFWDSIVSDEILLDFEIGAYVYDAVNTIFPIRSKYISTRVMETWEKDGFAAAKALGKEILDTEPQNWNTNITRMWRMALKLAQSDRVEDAIALSDMTIELYSSIAEAESISDMYTYKGLFQQMQGKKKEAKKSWEQALESYEFNAMAMELLR